MDKKFLKITQKGFEHYTGPLSVYEFVDGVSVEAIPAFERDRIAASMSCVEISETGKEGTAGVADRLVTDSKARAPKKEVFKTQSVEDKVAEERKAAEKAMGDTKTIYTEEQLDEIIKDGGISALRQVAETWGVKNRSIPALRQMILDEQDKYMAEHGKRVTKATEAVEKVVRDTAKANEEPAEPEASDEDADDASAPIEQEVQDEDVLATAAATGDMSAAISEEGAPLAPTAESATAAAGSASAAAASAEAVAASTQTSSATVATASETSAAEASTEEKAE